MVGKTLIIEMVLGFEVSKVAWCTLIFMAIGV